MHNFTRTLAINTPARPPVTMQDPKSRCYDESQPHEHSIIIATDGACKSNGRSDPAVGCGIFFGTNSVHNMSFSFPEIGIIKRRAELENNVCGLVVSAGRIGLCLRLFVCAML